MWADNKVRELYCQIMYFVTESIMKYRHTCLSEPQGYIPEKKNLNDLDALSSTRVV
jgi:hypothetical protein